MSRAFLSRRLGVTPCKVGPAQEGSVRSDEYKLPFRAFEVSSKHLNQERRDGYRAPRRLRLRLTHVTETAIDFFECSPDTNLSSQEAEIRNLQAEQLAHLQFRGHSVKTELVALDVLHHDARFVVVIGRQ